MSSDVLKILISSDFTDSQRIKSSFPTYSETWICGFYWISYTCMATHIHPLMQGCLHASCNARTPSRPHAACLLHRPARSPTHPFKRLHVWPAARQLTCTHTWPSRQLVGQPGHSGMRAGMCVRLTGVRMFRSAFGHEGVHAYGYVAMILHHESHWFWH
jgi:hypothetical protein